MPYKLTTIFIYSFTFLIVSYPIAMAQNFDSTAQVLNNYTEAVNGTFALAIFTVVIIGLGIAFMLGRIQVQTLLAVVIGIAVIVSAPQVAAIAGVGQ